MKETDKLIKSILTTSNETNGYIYVGHAIMAGSVYGNIIEATLSANTISTVSFNTNNDWKYLQIRGSNRAPSVIFRIYEIWLEK